MALSREVIQRLLLWAKRNGRGLARVEYSSAFAQQQIAEEMQEQLTAAGVLVTEIKLPTRRPATEIVTYLLAQLAQVPSGVVFVTGFATAFESQEPLESSLRIVNFNREALIEFPLRQVWWMTPVVVQTSLHAMPDLCGWFSPKLRLKGQVVVDRENAGKLAAQGGRNLNERSLNSRLEDARERSHQLLSQFETARAAGAEEMELLTTYLLPALEALSEVSAQQELRELTSRFEGLLGSLKVSRSPEVAIGLGQLARLYRDQGRYSEAEPLYVRSLKLRKTELGDRHPDTASSLNNLALLYDSMGRYEEAEPLYIESLEIRKTELGDRHPDTATSLNNLAGLYDSMGRYEEAEPLYIESLEIKKTELGDRHPSTANSLFNLAALYHNTQRQQQALDNIQQALDIYNHTLGIEHPTTKAAASWLQSIQQALQQALSENT